MKDRKVGLNGPLNLNGKASPFGRPLGVTALSNLAFLLVFGLTVGAKAVVFKVEDTFASVSSVAWVASVVVTVVSLAGDSVVVDAFKPRLNLRRGLLRET